MEFLYIMYLGIDETTGKGPLIPTNNIVFLMANINLNEYFG